VIKIENKAIFIADVHYPHHGNTIFDILNVSFLEKNQITQIFFLGDIFDILFANSKYLINYNRQLINIINSINKNINIYYFEGNHDFNLKEIFPNITIYPIENQPQKMLIGDKMVSISHGDKYEMGLGYKIYSKFIRNSFIIKYLIPFKKTLIKKQISKLKKKKICKKLSYFTKIVYKILLNYNSKDIVIEAHYHQGIIIDNYISLPSLACQKMIAIVENSKIILKKI
jgi:UDP-2,3-diacylglucosamine hydrolase